MKSASKIELDFSSNPDLGNIFAGKKIGDKCSIEIELRISEIDDKRAVGSITKVTSEYGDNDEKEAMPTPEEPMAMMIGPRKTYSDADES